ncbi:MAG: hypothetical protein E7L38_21040 [Klebsiella pneumoniae]|nr:hypothetical protein [Klebsiella pneumoniae]
MAPVEVAIRRSATAVAKSTPGAIGSRETQRADPFVVLSRIIAGKTKCVKDPFSAQILHEASHDAG